MGSRAYTVNYRADQPDRSWLNYGWFIHELPRLTPRCRMWGHPPVVDGTSTGLWVCCDRCGVRPQPQGNLDPSEWTAGQRYNGSWQVVPPDQRQLRALKDGSFYPPGPWPARPTGELGGQLVLGPLWGGVGASFEVGCAGSEYTLATHLRTPLISIYLHTRGFGTGLQRRLVPTGYEDRALQLRLDDGWLGWVLWADPSGSGGDRPRWRNRSVPVDPRDLLLGPRRYEYTDSGSELVHPVVLPDGQRYAVRLQLQRVRHGRRRGRGRRSWSARWRLDDGIPTRSDRPGGVTCAAVSVTERAVRAGSWPVQAAARIAVWVVDRRVQNGYLPVRTAG